MVYSLCSTFDKPYYNLIVVYQKAGEIKPKDCLKLPQKRELTGS